MKKILLFLVANCVFSCFAASDKSLFHLDEGKVSSEFQQLNQLEQFVAADEEITLSRLRVENNQLLQSANLDIDRSNTFSISRVTGDDEDKTMMYVLIGVGALVLLGLGAWLMFCLIG